MLMLYAGSRGHLSGQTRRLRHPGRRVDDGDLEAVVLLLLKRRRLPVKADVKVSVKVRE